ncbi:structural polyprotein [Parasponia andersonii]|uniref:Structural polyprotein n=1 Tax=Parasponia andersonii TaxID=3476 RepID=A0A2P5BCM4_PARAD|nr:structural polyprotein [Parasponia andersonii]
MVLLIVLTFIAMALISVPSLHAQDINGEIGGIGLRALLSFKETPYGSNATFECSPSGPCVPCLYSEKNDVKYRCSETGYRIPLKCVEIKHGSKDANEKVSRKSRSTLEIFPRNVKLHVHNLEELGTKLKHRRLLADSSTQERGNQAYITYRSCIPAVSEEKLSVLGFEEIVFCLLLVSGSFIYFRKKRTAALSGFGRIQTNSRF